ncbi:2-isopropylmalate synthase [uncultured Algimonas sp.]|uniref:2-isopropylmalate synthase n=1 Tax=uncultured Algimonas sp. TaxID=1547920 RepID=UPI0026133F72|nr:2-isopropylmalate synthase [uncultured Algimonas sp.]
MTPAVKIFDTTLRDGEQAPGFSMSAGQKLAMAEALEGLRVDVIEAGFAAASPGDFEGIKAIAEAVQDVTVCSLARCNDGDIRASGEAIRPAKSGRIHTFIATSPLHREFKLKMDKDEIVRRATQGVELARQYTDDVEFSCEDAIRTERDYMKRVCEAVIRAGATTINMPDTVGYTTPEEIGDLFRFLTTEVEGADTVIWSAHCHDDLGLAVANSLAAIRGGARQVECALNGIGERAGNCAMEEVVMALRTRKDFFGLDTNVRTEGLYGASKLLSAITGQMVPRNKAIVGKNAFAHESGIHQHGVLANRETYEIMKPEHVGVSTDNLVLGKHSGRAALKNRASKLGFTLSDNQLQSVFVAFKELADAKKEVFDSDIEALMLGEAVGQSGPWEIESLSVSAGSDADRMPEARVMLSHADGRREEHVSRSKGPMNAVFDAISQITDTPMQLEHYSVNSVSGGEDAMAEATVRVATEYESYQGRGASTDTVLASAQAWLDVINRIERRAVRQGKLAAQH